MKDEMDLHFSGKRFTEPEDLKNLVYRSYHFSGPFSSKSFKGEWKLCLDDLRDPKPVEPSKGGCFGVLGVVKEVQAREVKVHVVKEETRYEKGWELDVTIHLENGLSDPNVGGKYAFKGTLEPFTPAVKDIKFKAEVYEQVVQRAE
jgi:hypothetical protein